MAAIIGDAAGPPLKAGGMIVADLTLDSLSLGGLRRLEGRNGLAYFSGSFDIKERNVRE
jgi:hypothetical protein